MGSFPNGATPHRAGVHVGMALGDLELISQRPYGRAHIGFVGDCINVAARLKAQAGTDEIVMTNSLHQRLSAERQADFVATEPIEAKNVGCLAAWRCQVAI